MRATVSHFEIPAEEVERAKRFYNDAFGWEIVPVPNMDYNMVHTTQTDKDGMLKEPGVINGGMMKRSAEVKHPVITIVVDDIDEALRRVKSLGGKVTVDKSSAGEFGQSAYFEDPEGNVMGLFQPSMRPPP